MREGRFDLDSCSIKGFMSFLFEEEAINQIKIIGRSMEPTIMQGEIVSFEQNYSELKIGDVVLFYNKDHFTTHRIIDIAIEKGEKYYITRGDAIQTNTERISENVIVGRVVMC